MTKLPVTLSADAAAALDTNPDRIPWTDVGNAHRLVLAHGADLRYCHPWRSWIAYDGRRWQVDETGEVMRRAKQVVRAMLLAAIEADNRGFRGHAIASERAGPLNAMVTLAQSDLPVLPAQLDRDPWALNVANGTLDLRTGDLCPHDRADLFTKLAPVAYDPDARLPLLDSFLERVLPDPETRRWSQRVAGYTLTGDTSEERLFLVHGPAGTGKSTWIEAQKALLGDYAKTADFEAFLHSRRNPSGPSEDLARLAGARFVTSIEVEHGRKLAHGIDKQFTGGDTIAARFAYKGTFEYVSQAKLFLVANNRPRANADDSGMKRRLLEVPFTTVIPEAERDPAVKATLRDPSAAGPALLAWAVQGCLAWQREGLGEPAAVRDATDEFWEEMDPLADFLAERCTLAAHYRTPVAEIHDAYVRWAAEAGERPMSKNELGRHLGARGFTEARGGGGKRLRLGLSLLAEER